LNSRGALSGKGSPMLKVFEGNLSQLKWVVGHVFRGGISLVSHSTFSSLLN